MINILNFSECNEYSKLIEKSFHFGSLSLDSVSQDSTYAVCHALSGLVVGGENAGINEFPHQAAIGYPNLNGRLDFSCGGSLISDLFVLTAAHCEQAGRTLATTVRLGDLNLKEREIGLPEVDIQIDKFISHENYNTETNENDIAVIKMRKAAEFSKSIRPACLQQTRNIDGTKAVATGWGKKKFQAFAKQLPVIYFFQGTLKLGDHNLIFCKRFKSTSLTTKSVQIYTMMDRIIIFLSHKSALEF